ncbi:hypothetical protein HJFPF1_07370 [Paramyrothecium foliicola]|nr:hypothetical protein HJFPF1_07370 [Paramyrothecium foliicola]
MDSGKGPVQQEMEQSEATWKTFRAIKGPRNVKSLEDVDERIRHIFTLNRSPFGEYSYTCKLDPKVRVPPSVDIPLTISGISVVIPAQAHQPQDKALSCPRDPLPSPINPGTSLSDDLAQQILALYDEALGFYLLIDGQLQIIVPRDFNTARALEKKPRAFGGLRVSYVLESFQQCPVKESEVETLDLTRRHELWAEHKALASSKTVLDFMTVQVQARCASPHGDDEWQHLQGWPVLSTECALGVSTTCGGARYFTLPTHIVNKPLLTAKLNFTKRTHTKPRVRGGLTKAELGHIDVTFDQDASSGSWPVACSHDVSLLQYDYRIWYEDEEFLEPGHLAPVTTTWLSRSEWESMNLHDTSLVLFRATNALEKPARESDLSPEDTARVLYPHMFPSRESYPTGHELYLADFECRVVGQSFFRATRPKPSKSLFSFSKDSRSGEKDSAKEDAPCAVGRSLLVRSPSPETRGPTKQHIGEALCVVEERDDGERRAKVAGFISFSQLTHTVNIKPPSDKVLSEFPTSYAHEAFHGAFQVPLDMVEKHTICRSRLSEVRVG